MADPSVLGLKPETWIEIGCAVGFLLGGAVTAISARRAAKKHSEELTERIAAPVARVQSELIPPGDGEPKVHQKIDFIARAVDDGFRTVHERMNNADGRMQDFSDRIRDLERESLRAVHSRGRMESLMKKVERTVSDQNKAANGHQDPLGDDG